MTLVHKQDSNITGLRYCEEDSLGVLPATADQVWYPAEPNSYSNFGGQIKTVARLPINASRQNQKGVTVDLDASGGWNSDVTKTNALRFLQGFMFADFREHYDTQSFNDSSDVSAVSAVATSDDTFRMDQSDDLSDVLANHLILTSDFSNAGNNGLLTVASATSAKAGSTLTLTPGAIADDKVTIGSYTYQFVTGAAGAGGTGASGSPFTVSKGASDTEAFANLRKAINLTGVAGTDYGTSTVIHPDVTATASDSTTMDVSAKKYGRAGNAVATTVTVVTTDDGLAWDGATLTGGEADIATVENLTDEASPPSAARVQVVGYLFASATLDVDVSHSLPRLTRASGAVDFTTLNLVPGQFIFVGGDSAGLKFVNAANSGYARVKSVAATYIELDKTTSTMAAETGTGLTVQIFFGKVLKNESDPALIKRRSFQLERDLGQADTSVAAHQGEYLVGAVGNELTLNVKQADKLNADLTFVATDNVQRTQADGLLSTIAADGGGSAPAITAEDAYNTSSHVARLRMTILSDTDANPTPLFAYLTDFTVLVNNNVTPNKAVSVLGAFDLTAGQFDVSGKITAYFADVAAVAAVRNNSDVSLDFAFARDNAGILFDVPLTSLGDGRLNVQLNNPITLPLDLNAGADRNFDHTLLVEFFPYLPDAAM